MDVIRYGDNYEEIWDKFINEASINGCFLQTRAFLNYHPKGKFQDCSLLICDNNNIHNLYAVIPACEYSEVGIRIFYSHMGSTFGGLVISKLRYNVQDVSEIIDCFDAWLKENSYQKSVLKITPDLFAKDQTDLLQYLLWNRNYEQYTELSTYIDFSIYGQDIMSNFNQGKKYDVKRCLKYSLEGKILENSSEVSAFYETLCENLQKYDAEPIHTIDELYDIRNRLKDGVTFYGIYNGDQLVAGSMLFFFHNTNTYHTQYLCAKQSIKNYSPMSFLIYKLIEYVQSRGAKCLSFGISTEQKGRMLNMGLIKAKEAYGSSFSLNRTFYRNVY